jgi:hypothetical protein
MKAWRWSLIVSAETKLGINFNGLEVIVNIQTYCLHIIREAIKITNHTHNLISEDGYRLSKPWLRLFPSKPTTQPLSLKNH